MRRSYSRLASVEERKNIRKAVFFIILSILAIVFLFTFGLPTIVRFASFIGDLARSETPIEATDTTPPAPPRIDSPPEYTNQTSITISGSTEPGATIIAFMNSKEEEVLADKDGNFSIRFTLNRGENIFSAIVRDSSGNESQKTQVYKIVFDNEPPEITIDSPDDGSQFFGNRQRQVVIQGKTESEATLTINERLVVVDQEGGFSFATTLSEGENTFKIVAEDRAGNSAETSITLHYTP